MTRCSASDGHSGANRTGLYGQQMVLGTAPAHRGADFYDKPDGERLHLANWIECIKSRKVPSAPAEGGVGSAAAAHLANLALRNGGAAAWKA